MSKDAVELLTHMLEVDPVKRWSASECLLHAWITGRSHTESMSKHLEDAQNAMKARIEKKKRKQAEAKARAAAAAATHSR